MYRIEVAPGEESVFRTMEELAVGIRNGVVTPRARIYHHASQKWLPISLHPHYKRALDMPAAKAAQPSAKGLTPRPSLPPRRPEPRSIAPTREPKPVSRTAPSQQPAPAAEPPRMIPAPVPSPVVAMQQEVLRDLPVVTIPEPFAATPAPEPLPWSPPAPRVAAPPPPPSVQAHPTVAAAPTPSAERAEERVGRRGKEQPHAVPAMESQHGGLAPDSEHARVEAAAPPRPTARRSPRVNGRPMVLVGVAAALVIGTHLALTATESPDRAEPTVPAVAIDEPHALRAAAEQPVSQSAAKRSVSPQPEQPEPAEPTRVTTDPARVPMTPGPAFAGSAPARPRVSSGGVPSTRTRVAGSQAAPATLAASGDAGPSRTPAIVPPPAELELALPDLPADSIVPKPRAGDTLAMKKILRALNGTKP